MWYLPLRCCKTHTQSFLSLPAKNTVSIYTFQINFTAHLHDFNPCEVSVNNKKKKYDKIQTWSVRKKTKGKTKQCTLFKSFNWFLMFPVFKCKYLKPVWMKYCPLIFLFSGRLATIPLSLRKTMANISQPGKHILGWDKHKSF